MPARPVSDQATLRVDPKTKLPVYLMEFPAPKSCVTKRTRIWDDSGQQQWVVIRDSEKTIEISGSRRGNDQAQLQLRLVALNPEGATCRLVQVQQQVVPRHWAGCV